MLRALTLIIPTLLLSFIVQAQSIIITSPNGGEVWQGCTTQTITWTDSGTSDFYSIDYSVDNGSTWTSIATFYNTTDGEYVWTIPNIQSTSALVRVQDSNNALVEDISNVPFSMIAPLLLVSPNGGEVWEGGTTETIDWVATGLSNEYVLEYSTDGGNTWSYIDNYHYTTSSEFNWNIPNDPSPAALVRVTDYYDACKSDQSNQLFEIAPATAVITVNNPTSGETIYVGASENITWSSQFIASNQVQIEYTTDGGATWTLIASSTENDGSYPWTVPNEVTSNGFIRITDLANPATFDTNDSAFSIAEPFIDINTPTVGSNWTECEGISINWTAGGVHPNKRFTLAYSADGGTSWTNFQTNYTQSNLNNASYNWSRPDVEGPILIRVSDYYNAALFDIIDGPINLANNTDIIVTYPNGGETLEVGQTYTITWADVVSSYVSIEYSTDGGLSWDYVDSYDPSDGAINWTVPNVPTTEGVIRITETDYYCIEDESDAYFTISPPTSEIVSVNPGNSENQIVYATTSTNISWQTLYVDAEFVEIEYSIDNGSTWTTLIAATENDGSFPWNVPDVVTSSALVRISEIGGSTVGTSTYAFAIAEPFIDINTPEVGSNWTECEGISINWTAGGVHPNKRFTLAYSADGGTSWTNFQTNYTQSNLNNASYNWSRPDVEGPILIRVSDYYNAALFDIIDGPINLANNTDIIVTYPNGGETLEVGQTYTITWADVVTSYVSIEYSTDGGLSWDYVDSYDPSDGAINWTVPNVPTTEGVIRITETDYYCIEDESDAYFNIVQPSPTVNYPSNDGVVLAAGTQISIGWTDEYYNDSFVLLEYSIDNGATWSTITSAAPNTGSFSWPVPEDYTSEGLVRVTSVSDPSLTDVSDYPFEIAQPVTVTSPNGDNGIQDWRVCTETTVTWTSVGTSNYYDVFYSLDNGQTWITIAFNYYSTGATHSYDWLMPNIPGPGVKVMVRDRYNTALQDESDDFFTIAPAITITAPNGGETLGSGDEVLITWLNEGANNFYDIDYSSNGGATWNNIVFNEFIADASYLWTIPAQLGTNYVVRVRDHFDNCKSDVSDNAFEVSIKSPASIVVTAPSGSETWEGCTQQVISWNSLETSNFFDIDYSVDGGLNWTNIVQDYFTTTNSFTWTVPNTTANLVFFRVSDSQAPAVNDQSDQVIQLEGHAVVVNTVAEICAGESVVLQATGGVSFSWTPAEGLQGSNTASPIASPMISTSYQVTSTDENGCQATAQVQVNVSTDCEVSGCTDTSAYNYNPAATIDDGFCLYTEGGGTGSGCQGDLTGDNVVNASDLLTFLSNFGNSCN